MPDQERSLPSELEVDLLLADLVGGERQAVFRALIRLAEEIAEVRREVKSLSYDPEHEEHTVARLRYRALLSKIVHEVALPKRSQRTQVFLPPGWGRTDVVMYGHSGETTHRPVDVVGERGGADVGGAATRIIGVDAATPTRQERGDQEEAVLSQAKLIVGEARTRQKLRRGLALFASAQLFAGVAALALYDLIRFVGYGVPSVIHPYFDLGLIPFGIGLSATAARALLDLVRENA